MDKYILEHAAKCMRSCSVSTDGILSVDINEWIAILALIERRITDATEEPERLPSDLTHAAQLIYKEYVADLERMINQCYGSFYNMTAAIESLSLIAVLSNLLTVGTAPNYGGNSP